MFLGGTFPFTNSENGDELFNNSENEDELFLSVEHGPTDIKEFAMSLLDISVLPLIGGVLTVLVIGKLLVMYMIV